MTTSATDAARELEAGIEALRAGDLVTAVPALEAAAARGSRDAHMALVGVLLSGGVKRDAPQAYQHLCAAAVEPWAPADMMLAACDRSGTGVAPDASRAWQRLRRALEGGQPAAWRTYGMLRALAEDLPTAEAALRWAHRSGDGYAAHVLGVLALDAGAFGEAAGWFERCPKLGLSRRRRAELKVDAVAPRLDVDMDRPALPDAEPWPQARAAPRVEVIHGGPVQVRLARGALTRLECDHLIVVAAPSMSVSMTVEPTTGRQLVNSIRTSREMSFANAFPDLIVHEAELRIAAVAQHPLEATEPLVSLHYEVGGRYLAHHDFFTPAALESPDGAHLGQRVATAITYLNRVEQGGGTAFPRLGVEVAPEPGAVLSFRNVADDGVPISDSLHAGLPVLAGEKWIATLWCSTRLTRRLLVGSVDRETAAG